MIERRVTTKPSQHHYTASRHRYACNELSSFSCRAVFHTDCTHTDVHGVDVLPVIWVYYKIAACMQISNAHPACAYSHTCTVSTPTLGLDIQRKSLEGTVRSLGSTAAICERARLSNRVVSISPRCKHSVAWTRHHESRIFSPPRRYLCLRCCR